MKNEKINAYQFLVIVIFFTIGTSILTVPSGLAEDARQDAWIVAIVGTVLGLFVIWIYNKLGLMFPNMTFIKMNIEIFGIWLGKIISLIFVTMPFLYTSIVLIYNGNFLLIHMMPNTPILAVNILMVIIVVMGVRLGIETIGRAAEIFVLFFFILFIILVVFISPQIKLENIQPVFETDMKTVLHASISLVVTSSLSSVVLLMIFPALVNQPEEASKSFYIGNILGGLVIIIITVLSILVLGADTTERQTYPSFMLARKINIGHIIQRIEGTIAIMWFISIYFKTVLYFYASVLGTAQILNMKQYRPLILPFGLIITVLSIIMYVNVGKQQDFYINFTIPYSLTLGFFLPLIMLVVGVFKKKSSRQKIK
ncbi:spore germination protein KB [Oikeobacillus pervagus]|uniref:Spore germination protein KB n=1 Tax=Oikeobacillus pervagus TaxID=1325931 RepID=A0AAJ1T021_9BACI|nr:endospore germination permease [Oikeobacillus pervagus]MDQ0215819.1 spore germination protein KB [Oikeobacillus pervagus]